MSRTRNDIHGTVARKRRLGIARAVTPLATEFSFFIATADAASLMVPRANPSPAIPQGDPGVSGVNGVGVRAEGGMRRKFDRLYYLGEARGYWCYSVA